MSRTPVTLIRHDTGRNIAELSVGLPPEWLQWHPSAGPADPDRLAATRATKPRAAAHLADGIRTVDRHVRSAVGVFDVAAVWAPDPADGTIAGWMVSEVLMGAERENPSEKYFERNHETPRVRGRRYFGYDARMAGELPAGTAVLISRSYADRGGVKIDDTEVTIFPHDCDEAVQLTFSHSDRAFSKQMAQAAGTVGRNVRVTVGHLLPAGSKRI